MTKEFRQADKLAQQRVKLAQKYGLDLVAVERVNAEERARVLEQVIASRVGGLTSFLNEMKFGDLFEGDAKTRRQALLDEISTVQTEANAGVDGAADRLVDLFRRLVDTSEEAFGTAGTELSDDRARAQAGVEQVIAMENTRIADAQAAAEASLAAVQTGNELTNESNNLLAEGNSLLRLIAQGVNPSATVTAPDFSATQRQTALN